MGKQYCDTVENMFLFQLTVKDNDFQPLKVSVSYFRKNDFRHIVLIFLSAMVGHKGRSKNRDDARTVFTFVQTNAGYYYKRKSHYGGTQILERV